MLTIRGWFYVLCLALRRGGSESSDSDAMCMCARSVCACYVYVCMYVCVHAMCMCACMCLHAMCVCVCVCVCVYMLCVCVHSTMWLALDFNSQLAKELLSSQQQLQTLLRSSEVLPPQGQVRGEGSDKPMWPQVFAFLAIRSTI